MVDQFKFLTTMHFDAKHSDAAKRPDIMDRFTAGTQEGELPREYIVRKLYTYNALDPSNAKDCKRVTRLAKKDVSDYQDSVRVKENKKTGRLEADDDNDDRARDLLWCDALLSALNPLEDICNELMRSNSLGAISHVPLLVEGFLNIRQNHAQFLGEIPESPKCQETGRDIQRLGETVPSWLADLCQEYVLTAFTKSFEAGNHALAFSKINMQSDLCEPAKLCLSVLTPTQLCIIQKKQTDEVCKVLEKHVSNWGNKAKVEAASESKKDPIKGKRNKGRDIVDILQGSSVVSTRTSLTSVPNYLRQFAETACSTIKTDVSCTELFYGSGADSSGSACSFKKPEESWVLLAFSYLIQSYLSCTVSMSEANLLKCRKQLSVCQSYASFHARYVLLVNQLPMDIVIKQSDLVQFARNAQETAAVESDTLAKLVDSMATLDDVREVLVTAKKIGSSRIGADRGKLEQAHSLKKALGLHVWNDRLKSGTLW